MTTLTVHTLTPTEVDTIRVALLLLADLPPESYELQHAVGLVAAPEILSDHQTVRLSEQLGAARSITVHGVTT
jgi:hypothetical protein